MLNQDSTLIATPIIRRAEEADKPAALRLVREFMTHMHARGSEVLPTDRTASFYAAVFDSYINGDVDGAALVVVNPADGDLVGISMAGHELPFDTIYGKTATGWLTYVTPTTRGHGIGTHLRAELRSALSALGFRAIAAGYHTWNEQSRRFVERRGFKSIQLYGIETLDDPASVEAP